ncbi:signal peptidase I [Pseudanabaena sp. FACHB-1998]|uniref:signal peptidase I n=1 Tax=Pseudanabaena sp. FACHB-1998 TaxID=2692858 RepID=UPI0016809044|nr:signal peptidase I [Pseudanabaena sp. FACHB-1998]MBD2179032.1 signal peptidase I [Pseudanabaena sp. FACHB-1998]
MSTESKLDSQVTVKPWWQQHGETIRIFAVALAIAIFLRAFIVEPRFIPSGSMEPTLQVGDRILVDKISQKWQAPQRGDILIFYPPKSPAIEDNSKAYIKRLIGLEGDRIAVKNGKVYRNDHPLNESYIAEAPKYAMREVVVPNGYYWMMGDNRNHSNDSHIWGFLPKENVIGKATIRFFPFGDRLGAITKAK